MRSTPKCSFACLLVVSLSASLIASCGGPTVVANPIVATKKPVEKPKKLDRSNEGSPVGLAEKIELKGYQTIWVRDTRMLCTLLKTSWDEIDDSSREGRMTITCNLGTGAREVTIDEGASRTMFGFKIAVSYAYEYYNPNKGTYVPHAKFTITK